MILMMPKAWDWKNTYSKVTIYFYWFKEKGNLNYVTLYPMVRST